MAVSDPQLCPPVWGQAGMFAGPLGVLAAVYGRHLPWLLSGQVVRLFILTYGETRIHLALLFLVWSSFCNNSLFYQRVISSRTD